MMQWQTQPRTLEVASDAFPTHLDMPIFVAARLRGTEKLGRLYDYELDVSTIEAPGFHVSRLHEYIDVNQLVGKRITVGIAFEGNGAWALNGGGINMGAGVRDISGVIAAVKCLGADDRRMFYRFRVRPWLWLASLNRENRVFLDRTVEEVTREVLAKYPFPVRYRLNGPGYGRRTYPKRDYQRQWYESDWKFLNRLWQEWGITFHFDGIELVLFDGATWTKHGPAYHTIRYIERGGQRIDEEHIHKLELTRELTTGKVTVTDYDYTWGEANLQRTIELHRDASNDNAEEYIQADYAQPLQGAMGLHGERNDWDFEADHLARMRAEAHRCRSRRIKGEGNLRGLTTGFTFELEGYTYKPVNDQYVVTGTKIEIVNNDTVTQSGVHEPRYTCHTKFTAQKASQVFRTPLTAKKPRAFAETAVVTGYDKAAITTDALARLRLWFTWDRVGTRDGQASCWVPLAQVWQGNRYGAIWIPRVDDHVHIGYVNSDPDRPFVLASHTTNDNTTPWDLPGNEALSGWRSQDIGGNSVASNSVVTDDTAGKLQVQVTSDHANSRLVLGSNTRIEGNRGRTQARGEGFELATDAHGVVRANKGMLLTTEPRAGARAPMKDMGETVQRLATAGQQHEYLADLARQNGVRDTESNQADVADVIALQNESIRGSFNFNRSNQFPELVNPHLVLASPSGIEATTSQSTHIASGEHIALTSGLHLSMAATGRLFASAMRGVRLFCQRAGMKLVAAAGDIDLNALSDSINILAKLNITQSGNRITLTANEEILINGGGSYTRWSASGIETGTAEAWVVHAASKDFLGPQSMPASIPVTDVWQEGEFEIAMMALSAEGNPLEGSTVSLFSHNEGKSMLDTGVDDDGITQTLRKDGNHRYDALLGYEGWTGHFEEVRDEEEGFAFDPGVLDENRELELS